MKRKLLILCLITLISIVSGCKRTNNYDIDYQCSQNYKGQSLYVLNWGDYIDPDLVDIFEERCNAKVVEEVATDNETMRTRLLSNATKYDILVPSDYMVHHLSEDNLLEPLDHSLLPNFANIDPQFKSQIYDPEDKFSIPYFWGTVGIMYNKKELAELNISEADLHDWNVLWNKSFGDNNIQIYESVRDVFMFALVANGDAVNTTDKARIDAAREKLVTLNQKHRIKYATDTIKTDIVDGNAAIGITYNGDFVNMYQELKGNNSEINIGWVIPDQGSNIWYDTFVIPKVSQNKKLAHEFINFFLDAKVSYYNTIYVGYSTPNIEAYKLLEADEEYSDLVHLDAYKPHNTEIIDKSDPYLYLGDEIFNYYNESYKQLRNLK